VRIATNVVTGFLGVGKTTAILELLARRTDGERWAVLVNEYGEVGIDGAVLEGAGVAVREVAGGCVCCATAPYLQVALHLLLTEAKPTRLIVETTGLGHPGQLVETLRRSYSDRLDIRATVAIVSPDDYLAPGMLENPVFREQVAMADVLVLNKLDRASADTVESFQRWANGLEPPKLLIAATRSGRLERDWLDLGGSRAGLGLADESPMEFRVPVAAPEPGRPRRFASPGDPRSCGWIFSPADRFDRDRLIAFLGRLSGTDRLKGVFLVADGGIAVNRVGDTTTVTSTDFDRDSRVQVFARERLDWDRIEIELRNCLLV
jgi:G3E family GTPase